MARLSEKENALLAGGEAGFLLRWKARAIAMVSGADEPPAGMVAGLAEDEPNVDDFVRVREALPRFRELPEYFAWDSLAAEMKANILVGVEAGEAVRSRSTTVSIGWKAGLVFAGLALLMVSGYWWQLPGRLAGTPASVAQAVLEAGPGGLEVMESENVFSVVFDQNSGQQTLSGGLGSVRADYVDRETGQLTVAHVYLD
jgi:hypothetical protein